MASPLGTAARVTGPAMPTLWGVHAHGTAAEQPRSLTSFMAALQLPARALANAACMYRAGVVHVSFRRMLLLLFLCCCLSVHFLDLGY